MIISKRKQLAILAVLLNGLVAQQAFAVDGCAVALCLVKGGSGINECKPILKAFFKDTALGKPPPRCQKQGGGDNSGSATNADQYNQATTGASMVASGSPDANPYGASMADKYSTAQSSSVTAAADAAVQVNAGVRTVDASTVLSTDNGKTAQANSAGDVADATTQVANATPTCVGAACNVEAANNAIDPALAAEATAEMIADGTWPLALPVIP